MDGMEGGLEPARGFQPRPVQALSGFLTWRRRNWLFPRPPNSLGTGRMQKTASAEAAGCRIDGAQDAKKQFWIKRGKSQRDKEVSCEH